MVVSSAAILDELVDYITAKQRLYRSCFSADLKRLETTHGTAVLAEALARIERDPWDQADHRVSEPWQYKREPATTPPGRRFPALDKVTRSPDQA
jgi:hypothetical protein